MNALRLGRAQLVVQENPDFKRRDWVRQWHGRRRFAEMLDISLEVVSQRTAPVRTVVSPPTSGCRR
jgi:hypothetical protein